MKNAHERFGWLDFDKPLKDTRTRIRVPVDRFIGEPATTDTGGVAHLVSVVGGDVDVGAIGAAISSQEWFTISGADIGKRRVWLGKDPHVFRGTIPLSSRARSFRHLLALSAQMAEDADVGRIVLSNPHPEFVLYRISERLGLPAHPSWAEWFWTALQQNERVQSLDGLGCRPIAIAGNKNEFLEWIGDALREGAIQIPSQAGAIRWRAFGAFSPD